MKQVIKFNKDFYSKDKIEKTISEFLDVAEGSFNQDNYEVELNIKDEYDMVNIVNEFKNHTLALMKNEINKKVQSGGGCGCGGPQKIKVNPNPHKFKYGDKEYYYNYYRVKKLENEYFLTTEGGDFIFLSNEEYYCLRDKKFEDQALIDKLVEKRFLFIDGEYSEIANQKKDRMSFLFQGPSLHIIVVTLRCNLKCVYCHASSVPMTKVNFDMQRAEARKTVNRIFDSPSHSITIEFQGGEPLLNYEIIQYIIQYATEKNKIMKKDLKFALVTNLTQMTDERLEYLIKHEVGICTSIDGPESLHNKNRQEYSKSIEWVKKINERYKTLDPTKFRLNALPTITKESMNYPKELVDEYINMGLQTTFLRQLNPLGTAKDKDEIFYTSEEYIKFWQDILDYILEKNKAGIYFEEYFTKLVLKKIFEQVDPNYSELRNPCGAVTGQLLYHYNGNIYSCDEGRMLGDDMFKLGTVDDSYAKITTNPTSCGIVAASITDTQYCDKCAYKPYCGLCPVVNYSTSNSSIANIYSQDRCKILMGQFEFIFDKINNDKDAREIFLRWIKTPDQPGLAQCNI